MTGQQKRLLHAGLVVQAVIACFFTLAAVPGIGAETKQMTQEEKKMTIGAYYFDGWAGRNQLAGDAKEPWARNAPTHLSRRMIEEFPEREPVWGWRDDSLKIMEQQTDLAADNGLAFFAFCWYWRDDGRAINKQAIKDDPLHTSLELYLKAKNNRRVKFCLLVANHEGAEIKGAENWQQAVEFWMPYLKHPEQTTAERIVLIYAWNEFGEGGYLAPTKGDPDGKYLKALRSVAMPSGGR